MNLQGFVLVVKVEYFECYPFSLLIISQLLKYNTFFGFLYNKKEINVTLKI